MDRGSGVSRIPTQAVIDQITRYSPVKHGDIIRATPAEEGVYAERSYFETTVYHVLYEDGHEERYWVRAGVPVLIPRSQWRKA